MKKLLSIKLIILLLLSLIPNNLSAEKEKNNRFFIVTAYYSPLPNQESYITGNYKSEKILNGEGIRGASGKGVFSGMLAAPKKYNFGTKISLEGLGIGEVSDRGGAIVKKGERGFKYDRIDVWVGYGDEGLKRALYWGKRIVRGTIISSNSKVNINYKKIPAPDWATENIKKTPNIFSKGLGKGSNKNEIKDLQKFLINIGLYKGNIDGIYNSELINSIYSFQIKNNIIKNEFTYGAGYFGKTTRKILKKMYQNGDFKEKTTSLTKKIEEKEKSIFFSPLKGIENTKELQKILKQLSLYKGEIDGVYTNIRDVILTYQLNKKIIQNETELGAGYFGPKTRKSLNKDYNLYSKKLEEIEKLETEIKKLEKKSKKESKEKVDNLGKPKFGEIGTNVREFQILLKELGYFNYKDTAIFGVKTRNGLIKYQTKNNIISSSNQLGAGTFGPKTKEKFKESIKKLLLEKKLKESGLSKKLKKLTEKINNEETEFSIENYKIIKV